MKTTKTIEQIIAPRPAHFVGDGFRVHNFIPGIPALSMRRMDPFIMFDYNSKFNFSPTDTPRGVGVHPHKGFETVTIAYQGKVAHHDSSGGGGIIGQGDVQWMTAGSGILHKEYHEKEFSQKGGDFQMVQLWVNLPKKDKETAPKYQSIKQAEMPVHLLDNNAGVVEIIAGDYQGKKGSAFTFSPVNLLNIRFDATGVAQMDFPAHYNTAVLVVEGEITINDQKTPTNHLALMANEGEVFTISANEKAVVLVLSGEPLNEPIAAHGPFVMNTQEELVKAFNDFNQGKFGHLAD